MNAADVAKLMSKIRFNLSKRRNLKSTEGPLGRHEKIKTTLTELFKHERIELNYQKGDECRGYAERLISDAIRYGDCHKPTMENASYWLNEKQLVHKLFKVLVPRYENYTVSYTKLWKLSIVQPGPLGNLRCVLELRGNIYPALGFKRRHNKNHIHNVLLEAARKEMYEEESCEILKSLESDYSLPSPDSAETDELENLELKSNSELEIEEKSELQESTELVKSHDKVKEENSVPKTCNPDDKVKTN